MRPEGLSERDFDILRDTLAPFASRVERVDLYGSRARGHHYAGSDIDLILAGDINLEDILRMMVAFDESRLAVHVDVQRYSPALEPKFEADVKRDAIVLFTRDDLLAARQLGGAQADRDALFDPTARRSNATH